MNVYAQLISPYASSRTKQKYHLLTPGDNLQRSESKNDLDSSTDQKVLSEQSSTRYIKICVICLLVFCGYLFSDPNRDLSILTFKDLDDSGQGQFFYYKPDDSRDWFPTGHYRGVGALLVEKQVILRKGDAYPIEQSAVARFREGGHIEGHHHKTAIETFTGIKGVCVFEVLKPDGNNEIVTLIPGSHLVVGPMTTHSVRNDEEDDCIMLTTLIAKDGGSEISHMFSKKKKNSFVYSHSGRSSMNISRRLRGQKTEGDRS